PDGGRRSIRIRSHNGDPVGIRPGLPRSNSHDLLALAEDFCNPLDPKCTIDVESNHVQRDLPVILELKSDDFAVPHTVHLLFLERPHLAIRQSFQLRILIAGCTRLVTVRQRILINLPRDGQRGSIQGPATSYTVKFKQIAGAAYSKEVISQYLHGFRLISG